MILNNASDIRIGSTGVDRVYVGSDLVWPNYTYRQVEYIKSTGTQYVVTDIVPTFDNAFVLDARFSGITLASTSGYLFGYALDGGHLDVQLKDGTWGYYMEAWYFAGFGWVDGQTGNEIHVDYSGVSSRAIIRLQRGTCCYGDQTCSANYPITAQAPSSGLPIFARATMSISPVPYAPFDYREMYLYGFKIYDGETLIHDLVPMERQPDGALGLYDTLTDKFYGNAGTGTFGKGSYVG